MEPTRPALICELEPDPIGHPRFAWPLYLLLPAVIAFGLHLIGVV
jgi:hypothetical protein